MKQMQVNNWTLISPSEFLRMCIYNYTVKHWYHKLANTYSESIIEMELSSKTVVRPEIISLCRNSIKASNRGPYDNMIFGIPMPENLKQHFELIILYVCLMGFSNALKIKIG